MVFNATFNNISVISWRSVLLVVETGENYRPVASHWQTLWLLLICFAQNRIFIASHISVCTFRAMLLRKIHSCKTNPWLSIYLSSVMLDLQYCCRHLRCTSVPLYWGHIDISMIYLQSLIWFAGNGLQISAHILGFVCNVILLWEIHSHKANQW